MTHTKIVFYKLLHVLPPVEHSQLDGKVRSPVEVLDEGVNGLPHPGVQLWPNSIMNLVPQHFIYSLLIFRPGY